MTWLTSILVIIFLNGIVLLYRRYWFSGASLILLGIVIFWGNLPPVSSTPPIFPHYKSKAPIVDTAKCKVPALPPDLKNQQAEYEERLRRHKIRARENFYPTDRGHGFKTIILNDQYWLTYDGWKLLKCKDCQEICSKVNGRLPQKSEWEYINTHDRYSSIRHNTGGKRRSWREHNGRKKKSYEDAPAFWDDGCNQTILHPSFILFFKSEFSTDNLYINCACVLNEKVTIRD